MENNIALNMREIADKVNEEKERQRLKKHQEFVKEEILPSLQLLAEKGEYQMSFTAPGYNAIIIRDLLRQMGFTVDTYTHSNIRHLWVKW